MSNKKANNLRNIILSTALSVLLFASCTSRSDNKQKEQAPVKTELQKRQEINQRRAYLADSVRAVNGYDKYNARLNANRWYGSDEFDVRDLQYKYSLAGVMEDKVIEAGYAIIDKAYQEIAFELSKYPLVMPLDKVIESKEPYFYFKRDMFEYQQECSKSEMCFAGLSADDNFYNADMAWNDFQDMIDSVIDDSEYGDQAKRTMKNKVSQIINKAKKDLIASRKKIEKQYSDYYVLSDYDKEYLGICWGGENTYSYGYNDLNRTGKYLITYRNANVYDSKLSVDFFGDPNATYKLVSLGNYNWQVIKKTKDGKIEKTPVFKDECDYYQSWAYCDSIPEHANDFNFIPGINMGVRVTSQEMVNVKSRKKDWKMQIPTNVQRTIDSLENEIQRKKELMRLVEKTRQDADSIADSMVQKTR